MIAKWQFWCVGSDIRMRHTTDPANERVVCNCAGPESAVQLVLLLNKIRFDSEEIQALFDLITFERIREITK